MTNETNHISEQCREQKPLYVVAGTSLFPYGTRKWDNPVFTCATVNDAHTAKGIIESMRSSTIPQANADAEVVEQADKIIAMLEAYETAVDVYNAAITHIKAVEKIDINKVDYTASRKPEAAMNEAQRELSANSWNMACLIRLMRAALSTRAAQPGDDKLRELDAYKRICRTFVLTAALKRFGNSSDPAIKQKRFNYMEEEEKLMLQEAYDCIDRLQEQALQQQNKEECYACHGTKTVWDNFAGIGGFDQERNCPICTGNNDPVKKI